MRLVRYRGPDGDECVSSVDALPVEPLSSDTLELPPPYKLLVPVEPPEVWAAGVTYARSRDARIGESRVDGVYQTIYDADRPELFLKDAACRRTVGPGEPIGIREDSQWTVPEPEIALVLGERGRITAVTIGNDVSSRDIEGANPLYLPQAKIYAGACALGPALLLASDFDRSLDIQMRISDETGAQRFSGETSTKYMRRSFSELVNWLIRANPVPTGSVLMTGTGLVPPDDLTLMPGYTVEIHVPGIGTLSNPVCLAGDVGAGLGSVGPVPGERRKDSAV